MKVQLTEEVYHELNAKISEILGYGEGKDTVIYTNEQPEVVDGMCEMEITSEVVEKCSELLVEYGIEIPVVLINIEDEIL